MSDVESLASALEKMRGKNKVNRSDFKLVEGVVNDLQQGKPVQPSRIKAASKRARFWMN